MFKRITLLALILLILGIVGSSVGFAQLVDTDSDGIYDDGDNSGIVGDNHCTGGNTINCDDNCVNTYNPDQADLDGDGIGDACEDNAIDFSTGGHVEVVSSELPDIGNTELTVEAWVKSSTSSITGSIFSLGGGDIFSGRGMHMWVKEGEPKFGVTAHATGTPDSVGSLGNMLSEAWYHIAGVLTNSVHNHPESESCGSAVMSETPHLDMYINGEFKNCATTEALFAINPDSPQLNIGKVVYSISPATGWSGYEISTNDIFNGVIDEVRFWTAARTEAEIQQCMNYELGSIAGCEIDSSILKGYWRLDEGLGTVLTDSSGNGYSGDIVGSVVWANGYSFMDINLDGDGDGYTPLQGDCNDGDASVNPGAPDICDGKDNDCNPSTTDGLAESWYGTECDGADSDLCVEGVFECSAGVQSCTDTSDDDVEVCDGVDNDCDGQTDNFIRTTTCGTGQCSDNIGTETCVAGSWTNDTCDPLLGAVDEICDNEDNDCDGVVDEDLVNETTCGVGECSGNTGVITCITGNWINDTCDPYEGATDGEVCDGLDNDCDGSIDEDLGTTTCGIGVCERTIINCVDGLPQDCTPGEPTEIPEATCGDNLDNDCDTLTDMDDTDCLDVNLDGDGDGYTVLQGDCNDADALVYPGASEVCDGKDNDCDISTPDGFVESWVGDSCDGPDEDLCMEGVFECTEGVQSCTDTSDDDVEVCDGVDNDCDGQTDNFIRTTTCGTGQCSGNIGIETCVAGSWTNDTCDPLLGAVDEMCDNEDNDCDGVVDEDLVNETICGVGVCSDNTGFITCITGSWINDTCDPYEGASDEVTGNGIDEDCNPMTYDSPIDVDGDLDGYSDIQGDCNDTNPAVNSGAAEIPGNGIDDDCNPLTYDNPVNADGDGDGYTELQGDCDDTNSAVNPGAIEILNNGIDDDCNPLTYDGSPYSDDDGDGYAEIVESSDLVLLDGDCDDTNPAVNPGVTEVVDNGINDDCNLLTYDSDPDTDDDGDGYTENAGDCDDTNPAVSPDALEVPNNGIDDDCDSYTDDDGDVYIDEYTDVYIDSYTDDDGDGYTENAGDCDDTNPAVNPAAVEVPNNGIDDDCDVTTPITSVSGIGMISYADGKRVAMANADVSGKWRESMEVNADASGPSGFVKYYYTRQRVQLESTTLISVSEAAGSATITGTGDGTKRSGRTTAYCNGCSFTVIIKDDNINGDAMYIEIDNGNFHSSPGGLNALDEGDFTVIGQ